ncbi:hypothetical protein L873DRAFT_1833426 [Choiromyces venosus 120613-1]|uniref:LysM domain-containing protein n=1 Tax=Choiromyces venosus 120613-1 TaxID=1336337 RepID=A0A3N4K2S2_9PEZI|nr:hypothetical protein L873DRAFT_1833426 [Choiromyces venosus 120613-1]
MNSTSTSSSLPTSVASAARSGGGGSVGSGWGVQWSTLQGLASSVLGSDAVAATSDSPSTQPQGSAVAVRRRRRPTDGTTATGSGGAGGGGGGRRSQSSGSWLGEIPISENDSARGVGGSSSGDARSRPTRRSNFDESSSQNSIRSRKTSYKRPTSPDPTDDPAAPSTPEAEKDALAYVHHVKPTDTLEGIVIMYNIHASALRRANGMWPNDSVQRRKVLLLPVEDCGVKGKPVDLLNLDPTNDQEAKPSPPKKEPTPEEKAAAEERGYRHESYVMIENIGQVEIARLSRKKLSHFPPRRRKESVSTNTTTGFGTPPPDNETSVFRGMTPGVGALGGSGGEAGVGLQAEESFTKAFMELAQGTTASLENVGGVIEGFVRKWTARAQGFATHDLIELKQRLGLEIEEDGGGSVGGGGGRNGSGNASGSGSGGTAERDRRAGTSSARGDGRVVRERLPRPRRDGAKAGDKLL